MRQPPSSIEASSRGFTLMIMGGPGRVPRRFFVPHWVCASLLVGWLSVLALAAWYGFQLTPNQRSQSPAAATTGASATASPDPF
ncbi:MAG: hypothetical protein QM778_25455 [Myxococcales bacterium]